MLAYIRVNDLIRVGISGPNMEVSRNIWSKHDNGYFRLDWPEHGTAVGAPLQQYIGDQWCSVAYFSK